MTEQLYSKIMSRTKIAGQCLEWQGAKLNKSHTTKKYGRIIIDKKEWLVHRWVFIYINKWEPEAVLHTCDNPSCINPEHLVGGTRTSNNLDMDMKGRRNKFRAEKCRQGHDSWVEYNRSRNTVSGTSRYCSECRKGKKNDNDKLPS